MISAIMICMRHTKTRDLTKGSIAGSLLLFAVPLMFGNIFQMLYNTVDVMVVGNFVSSQALAAVGSTTMIVNMLVFFFNGFSVGAGVVIGQYFGAGERERLHDAVETTIAMTFIFCALFTVIGIGAVRPMLHLMSTPEAVLPDAVVYLRIYFLGITGLLIYNIGSGILRAVGNTTLPLLFLIMTSLLNIVLDLLFVLGFHAGIAGVAIATILSQFISAALTLVLLTRTKEVYRLIWKDLHIDFEMLRHIFTIALPAGIQSVITAFSNVFVQSYINYFGSAAMAGWSCYNKLDGFIMLPMQSMAMAATSFVSQNIGAKEEERAKRGITETIVMTLAVTGAAACVLFFNARAGISLFTQDQAVIDFGVLFLRTNIFFFLLNCVNHVLAGGLRGFGDAAGPMIIMLSTFVGVRQVYLFVMTRFISNTPAAVGFGYPVGWITCCVLEVTYFIVRARKGLLHAGTRQV